jgi:hypothetical protein
MYGVYSRSYRIPLSDESAFFILCNKLTMKNPKAGQTQAKASILDGQLTEVKRGNITLHFEDVNREGLWRTVL